MRYALLPALFMVLLLVPAATAFVSDGADPITGPNNYYIQGYVADTSKAPMEGVTVYVMDGSGNTTQGVTDGTGFFSVGVAVNTGLSISFVAFGYTAITCPNTTAIQGSDFLSLDLASLPISAYNSSTHAYTLPGTVADMRCAIMVASNGVLRGQVVTGDRAVNDATVTLAAVVDRRIFTAHTDSEGRYSITCPTGTYSVSASGQGLKGTEPVTVTVSDTPATLNIAMEKSPLKKYLGMDIAHVMMLLGVIVGIVLVAAAWFLSRRLNGPRGLEIINEDEEDDYYGSI